MPLINNIETLRKFVKVSYTNETSELPNFEKVEQRYLKDLLGPSLYSSMLSLANSNTTNNETLRLCQMFVAPMTIAQDLPLLNAIIGDKGVHTSNSENIVPISRWAFHQLRDHLTDEAAAALDILIEHLWNNKNSLNWAVPNDRDYLFKNGSDFSSYYRTYQPHRNFEEFLDCLQLVTDENIIPEIGEDFYVELKNYTGDNVQIKKAVINLKKFAAYKTIEQSCNSKPVKITNKGFCVSMSFDRDIANAGDINANDNQIQNLKNNVSRTATNYLLQLKKFLNSNASSQLFTTYFNSIYYTNPNSVDTESINKTSKTFFL